MACLRETILSDSISDNDVISGVWIPEMTKEESWAGKYTERLESSLNWLGLRKTPIVDKAGVGSVLIGDPFLMLGQLHSYKRTSRGS